MRKVIPCQNEEVLLKRERFLEEKLKQWSGASEDGMRERRRKSEQK
jgi:hypothetical protein